MSGSQTRDIYVRLMVECIDEKNDSIQQIIVVAFDDEDEIEKMRSNGFEDMIECLESSFPLEYRIDSEPQLISYIDHRVMHEKDVRCNMRWDGNRGTWMIPLVFEDE